MFARIKFFLHPLPILCVFLVALNDHYFKGHFPGVVVGKLSDFAGLFYFPIFILAVVQLFLQRQVTLRDFWIVAVFVDLLFILIKTNTEFNLVVTRITLLWLPQSQFVMDRSDLLALISTPLAAIFIKGRIGT